MKTHIFFIACGECDTVARCVTSTESLMQFQEHVELRRNSLTESGWLFTPQADICPACANKPVKKAAKE